MASPFILSGMAWTGTGAVRSVEVSLDGGMSWMETVLDRNGSFTIWSHRVTTNQRPLEITVRATDTAGNTQPTQARWNANGYANNVCHNIKIMQDQG